MKQVQLALCLVNWMREKEVASSPGFLFSKTEGLGWPIFKVPPSLVL